MRIIVLGYVVRGPMGGMSSLHLPYLKGLRALGHEVFFLEFGGDWPCCYDPRDLSMTNDPTFGLGYAQQLFEPHGFGGDWGYFDPIKNQWHGPLTGWTDDLIASADMVLNLCGVNELQQELEKIPIRVLLDQDPVYTQVKNLQKLDRQTHSSLHNRFFTFATNWGKPGCTVPKDGFNWKPTVQPIIVDDWPTDVPLAHEGVGHYTTIMQWRSYDPVEWDGVEYHMKDKSFPPYTDLPGKTEVGLEMALGKADKQAAAALSAAGWVLTDPRPVSATLPDYIQYIASSRGEFSIAKHGYVISGSGWFSERSTCYLACGRPVVLQDTGFSDYLPKDSAIGAFSSPEEAVAQIARIESDYPRYQREARGLAEAYFGYEAVLNDLLSQI